MWFTFTKRYVLRTFQLKRCIPTRYLSRNMNKWSIWIRHHKSKKLMYNQKRYFKRSTTELRGSKVAQTLAQYVRPYSWSHYTLTNYCISVNQTSGRYEYTGNYCSYSKLTLVSHDIRKNPPIHWSDSLFTRKAQEAIYPRNKYFSVAFDDWTGCSDPILTKTKGAAGTEMVRWIKKAQRQTRYIVKRLHADNVESLEHTTS